ncbi:nicotinamide riboside transporter PnuC [Chitinophaga lutea]
MNELTQGILEGFRQMSGWEIVAVLFGVISVLCSRQNSIWVYPTGLVSTGIFVWLFIQPTMKLYAEAGLNVYYFVMSAYGWYHWARKKNEDAPVEILPVNRRELNIALAIAAGGWGVIYLVLRHFSDSDVPILDAFVSATAWAGMWLLARRKIENWIFLNISNLVSIPLLFYKKAPLIALLTIFLFIVAVNGYLHWRKLYRERLNEKSI